MIRHVWSILCERISIDQNSNLLSYFTCIEGIRTKKLPITLKPLSFGTRWCMEGENKEKIEFQLILVAPSGKEVRLHADQFTMLKKNHRSNFILDGLKIEEFGEYNFRMRMKKEDKWITVANIPLNVELESNKEIEAAKIKNRNKITDF
jgi:hypothetical protein